ncbi:MAG TPA: hypothetical protein VES19_00890, partial [Candidatus Limnocylindrales bacterium]|nr:hypothetical protein [Candidatus Limnocylindrales bacterium]
YGMDFRVPLPAGSDHLASIGEVADDLARRLETLFTRDETGRRPFRGPNTAPEPGGAIDDLVLFHEYFDGDTGRGLGASHQTGWTALVAKLLEQRSRSRMADGGQRETAAAGPPEPAAPSEPAAGEAPTTGAASA